MSLMICLKYTKPSAEVLFGKMRLKYNFTSLAIYSTPFYFCTPVYF